MTSFLDMLIASAYDRLVAEKANDAVAIDSHQQDLDIQKAVEASQNGWSDSGYVDNPRMTYNPATGLTEANRMPMTQEERDEHDRKIHMLQEANQAARDKLHGNPTDKDGKAIHVIENIFGKRA